MHVITCATIGGLHKRQPLLTTDYYTGRLNTIGISASLFIYELEPLLENTNSNHWEQHRSLTIHKTEINIDINIQDIDNYTAQIYLVMHFTELEFLCVDTIPIAHLKLVRPNLQDP